MRVTIDRIEGDVAVLISCEDDRMRLNIPVPLLPAGSREGDMLTMSIEREPDATFRARERVSGLISQLKQQ
ncbi:MAG: DUF3006 domain-containing protein [Methanoregula sp.]|jgi:hypothetical protein|nr:DUF3006 domain-containing protein [Methanoregula sp.]